MISDDLLLSIDGQQRGTAFRIPQVELPMALPVLVRNLNENWPAFLVDRDRRRWRPVGVLDRTAYATVDTNRQGWTLFIGHPVTASHADVVLSLAQISPDEWRLEVHNPTDRDLDVTVQPSPWFDLIDWAGATYDLRAGASVFETLRSAPQHNA